MDDKTMKAFREARVGVEMQELEVTWQRVLRIWWLITWRGLLGGLLLGFAFGAVVGLFGWFLGWSLEMIGMISRVLGGIMGLAWGLLVVRMALTKKYNGFGIVLNSRF